MLEIVESSNIKIVTRSTYDNDDYIKYSDIVYFVLEPVSNGKRYLSLYLGTDKQTDIIDIADLLGNANNTLPNMSEDNIPTNLINTINKLYYWEDTNLGVYKGYIKNSDNNILPLYGTPVWEAI